jgi:hypothetical protein
MRFETNWGGWEAPILVYEDSNLEIFTTKGAGLGVSPLLTHRVFDEDGTYHTFVVTHYTNGYPCKGLFTSRIPGKASAAQRARWAKVRAQQKSAA